MCSLIASMRADPQVLEAADDLAERALGLARDRRQRALGLAGAGQGCVASAALAALLALRALRSGLLTRWRSRRGSRPLATESARSASPVAATARCAAAISDRLTALPVSWLDAGADVAARSADAGVSVADLACRRAASASTSRWLLERRSVVGRGSAASPASGFGRRRWSPRGRWRARGLAMTFSSVVRCLGCDQRAAASPATWLSDARRAGGRQHRRSASPPASRAPGWPRSSWS